jgi:predicted DCC family thiol-disulfide oxidoreductase YuxK
MEQVLDRSDAALAILWDIGGPWRGVSWLRLLPRALRDAVYDFVAKRRYRWFGKLEACALPAPEQSDRFLP